MGEGDVVQMIPKLALKKLSFNKKLNLPNRPNTVKTYISTLNRVLKHTTWRKLMRPSQKLIRWINETIPSTQSRGVLYSALLKCVGKHGAPKYEKLLAICREQTEEAYSQQIPTMTLDRNEQRSKADESLTAFKVTPNKRTALRALLASLYITRAPRRLEFADVKHTNYNTETDNFYDKVKGQFVLNDYKTAQKYGPQVVDLTEIEIQIVNYLVSVSPGNGLFPFGRSGLSHYLKRHFGYSVNIARQGAISEIHKETPAIRTMRDMAKEMGHSVNAQLSYYTKKTNQSV